MSLFRRIKRGALDLGANTLSAPFRAVGLNWSRTPRTNLGERHQNAVNKLYEVTGLVTAGVVGGSAAGVFGKNHSTRELFSNLAGRVSGEGSFLEKAQNALTGAGQTLTDGLSRITGIFAQSAGPENTQTGQISHGANIAGLGIWQIVIVVGLILTIVFRGQIFGRGNKKGW